MKYTFLFFSLLICFTQQAVAQKRQPTQPVGCIDPQLRQDADVIKQHFLSQGFVVFRDAMINMESMVPFPVVVQLNAGQLYQIIYVGQTAATSHKIAVYDGGDNKVDERSISKKPGNEPTNFIVYEFSPTVTDTYMFTFMTRYKNKSFCGSVCIVAADRTKQELKYKPYIPSFIETNKR